MSAQPSHPADGGCWPTPSQQLILRAALLEGDSALAAWEAWQASVDIDYLDAGSNRLLPLLYHRLRGYHIQHPWMPRLKGIYRRTWYENQLLFHAMTELLGQFQSAGIPTLLLKGPALILGAYHDYGVRPMDDVDILVPTTQARAALDILKAAGYRPSPKSPEKFNLTYLDVIHSYPFMNGGGREVDLHWHALADDCQPDADAAFWAAAEPVTIENMPTHVLCAADQLLHVCTHGVRWNPVPPVRWVADAAMLIRANATLDWDRLVHQVQQRRVVLAVREALTYLAREMAVSIPEPILTQLYALSVDTAQRREYTAITRPSNANGPLLRLWLHYQHYRRTSPGKAWGEVPLGFMRYLQYRWGLEHVWQTPVYAIVGGSRRVWRKTNWEWHQMSETRHAATSQGS